MIPPWLNRELAGATRTIFRIVDHARRIVPVGTLGGKSRLYFLPSAATDRNPANWG